MVKQRDIKLMVSPLFVGLTRSPTVLGVTLDYLGVSALAALCGFILFAEPIYLILYLPMHIFGAAVTAIDPRLFSIILKQWACLPVPNRTLWGCQSYAPY